MLMEITPYGICFGIGIFAASYIVGTYSWELIGLLVIGLFIQSLLCKSCWDQFTMASVIGSLPLLFVLFLPDCNYLKRVLFAMAAGAVIGRIGCLLVGCCSGAETSSDNPFSLTYTDSFINKKLGKQSCSVKPTIILEIVLQFLLAWAVWRSEYGIVLYGVLNLTLLCLTNLWRLEKRMGGQTWVTYLSLAVFSVIAYFRCGKVKGLGDGAYEFKWPYIVVAVIVGLQTSNDFTVGKIVRYLKRYLGLESGN